MVKVVLSDGTTLEVPRGKSGVWNYKEVNESIRTPVEEGGTLDIRDKEGYGGVVVASFKATEVRGFVVESNSETKKEE